MLKSLRLEDEKGYAVATGTLDWQTRALDISLDADELDLDALTQTALKLSPSLKKQAAAMPNGLTTDGIAYVRGEGESPARITGTLTDPKLRARIVAYSVQFNQLVADEVNATVDVTKDRLIVGQAALLRTPGSVNLSGIVNNLRSENPEVSITATANNLDINYLLQTAGVKHSSVQVTGTVSTGDPVLLAGTLRNLYVRQPFTVQTDGLTVNGSQTLPVTAEAAYDRNGLHLLDASVRIGEGDIRASGFLYRDRSLDVRAQVENLNVNALTELLPEAFETLSGHINAQVSVAGTLEHPSADLSVTADTLRYSDTPIGQVTLKAKYANDALTIPQFALSELGGVKNAAAQLTSNDLRYDVKTKKLGGGVNWNGITLREVRDLVQTAADSLPDSAMSHDRLQTLATLFTTVTDTVQANTSGHIALSGTQSRAAGDGVLERYADHGCRVYRESGTW